MADIVIPITREQLEAKRKEAAAQGVVLQGDSGTAGAMNVEIMYDYDGTNLTIKVLSKPWYYSESLVEGEIRQWFE